VGLDCGHRTSSGHSNVADMNGLHVDSVRKQFGNRQILNDVFISCIPGEIVGLLGRNGSGKSTLLKIIFGAVQAQNKFVRVDGVVINSLSKANRLIQYLPNDGFLPLHLSIKDIISCFCSTESCRSVLENQFVSPFLKHQPGQLSGGERRAIEILIMLNSGAKYLLFDEPFNELSPLYVEVIKTMIRLHSAKKGIIVTDHNYEHVLDLSSSIILLDHGNTKPIENCHDLVALGYLPEGANSKMLKHHAPLL
jgi:ABC-type multidrug transport system ATPase subunit